MRTGLLLLVGGCVCCTALAWPPKPVPIADVTFHYWGGGTDRGSNVVYSNLEQSTDPNDFYLPQTESEVPYGDDLHLTAAGWMDGFTFAYYDPAGGTALSQVDVLFYENDPNNSDFPGGDPGSTLLGSYTVTDLPGNGVHIFAVDVSADPLSLPEDIWIEFDFSDSPEAGLVLYDPPTVGSSADLFEVHGVDVFVFEYPHIANFGLELTTGEGQPRCHGDLDGDNDRDLADLAELLGHYGDTTGVVYEDGDLDEDGDVDLSDLAELLGVYGEPCPE
ncbi:MAG: hypothetical protein KKI02_00870 [Planctomycetes bacterium]|nr:hypothetical protein [Planctomycetota bacterium]